MSSALYSSDVNASLISIFICITTATQLLNCYSYVSHHDLPLINRDAWDRMRSQPPSLSIQNYPTSEKGPVCGTQPLQPQASLLHPKFSACNRLFLLNNNASCRASFPGCKQIRLLPFMCAKTLPRSPRDSIISGQQMEPISTLSIIPHLWLSQPSQKINCLGSVKLAVSDQKGLRKGRLSKESLLLGKPYRVGTYLNL